MQDQFEIEKQKKSEWCWAAVAVSVDRYFNPASDLTQCKLAQKVVGEDQDCCKGENCNQPQQLHRVLHTINRHASVVRRSLRFEEICREIDAGRPVGARIAWVGGGAHFVVITGYRILQSGGRHVEVADPLYPSAILDYDELCNSYHSDGSWVEAYLVSASYKK